MVGTPVLFCHTYICPAELKAQTEQQAMVPSQSEFVDMEEYGRILGIGEPDELEKLLE